jgi:hypothetical protein
MRPPAVGEQDGRAARNNPEFAQALWKISVRLAGGDFPALAHWTMITRTNT